MQVGNIFSIGNNPYLKNAAYTTNYRSIAKALEQAKPDDAKRTGTAVFSIKPQRTRGNGVLQSLMEQKKGLEEQKQQLMEQNQKNGGPASTLKEQLDELNQQIEAINEQIMEQAAVSASEKAGKDKKNASTQSGDGKQEGNFDTLILASNSLENAKVVSAVQKHTEGQARVLESEIKLDRNVAHKPTVVLATSKEKLTELAGLKKKASQQMENVQGEISNAASHVQCKPGASDSEETEHEELAVTNELT